MVRTTDGEVVKLAPANWIALAGLLGALMATLIGGAWSISDATADLRGEVRHMRELYSDLKTRIERIESRLEGRVSRSP